MMAARTAAAHSRHRAVRRCWSSSVGVWRCFVHTSTLPHRHSRAFTLAITFRIQLLRAGYVLLRVRNNLLLAVLTSEVEGVILVGIHLGRLLGIDVHPANRVDQHLD